MSDVALERISSGVPGLDDVLGGGLIPGRSYLARGDPGTGKTLFGCSFLSRGVKVGEDALFVHLEEPEADVKKNAGAVGIDLDGVEFLDLSPNSGVFSSTQSYDIFDTDENEQTTFTERITDRVGTLSPDRVFIDPLTKLRYLTSDEYQFRKQVLALTRFFTEHDATVLLTSQNTSHSSDDDLQYLTDGTVQLRNGEMGRSLSVPKFRGSSVKSGEHAVRIGDGRPRANGENDGVSVFPALDPAETDRYTVGEQLSAGVPRLDELLGGGLERGTVTILSGPTGVGKTTVGTQFMKEAAGRGERSVVYLFEETTPTLFERSEAIGIPLEEMVENGALETREFEPLDNSAVEFANHVQREVERRDTSLVMIDGIDGYKLSLREADQRRLVRKLHSLCRYLKSVGVTVVLVDESATVMGEFSATDSGISYLADNIVFMRHLELNGEMRKAIGVLKKRTSDFERTLREFEITEHGITVGETLDELEGILTGEPQWTTPSEDNDE
ncbi:ATPase domain-containing protein [Halorussus halophilus]|uniref:ATPase domain-containing protein n=1 Tax=Halorussus halophilus TaxID=2650975 RepID=UPI0013014075|nr:ATPase domain-containing protein [Halorussus halophilus]